MSKNNILPFKNELFRKIVHLLSSFFPVLYFCIQKKQIILILVLANIVIFVIESNRLQKNYIGRFFNKYISFMIRPYEKSRFMNATYLCVSYLLIVLFFNKNIAIYSLLLLSISDSCAAIIGIKYGRIKIINSKTLEGTFAFIVSGIILISIISITKDYMIDYRTLYLGVIFSSIIELLTPSRYDNITVPFSYAFFLMLFLKI